MEDILTLIDREITKYDEEMRKWTECMYRSIEFSTNYWKCHDKQVAASTIRGYLGGLRRMIEENEKSE